MGKLIHIVTSIIEHLNFRVTYGFYFIFNNIFDILLIYFILYCVWLCCFLFSFCFLIIFIFLFSFFLSSYRPIFLLFFFKFVFSVYPISFFLFLIPGAQFIFDYFFTLKHFLWHFSLFSSFSFPFLQEKNSQDEVCLDGVFYKITKLNCLLFTVLSSCYPYLTKKRKTITFFFCFFPLWSKFGTMLNI